MVAFQSFFRTACSLLSLSSNWSNSLRSTHNSALASTTVSFASPEPWFPFKFLRSFVWKSSLKLNTDLFFFFFFKVLFVWRASSGITPRLRLPSTASLTARVAARVRWCWSEQAHTCADADLKHSLFHAISQRDVGFLWNATRLRQPDLLRMTESRTSTRRRVAFFDLSCRVRRGLLWPGSGRVPFKAVPEWRCLRRRPWHVPVLLCRRYVSVQHSFISR